MFCIIQYYGLFVANHLRYFPFFERSSSKELMQTYSGCGDDSSEVWVHYTDINDNGASLDWV